MTAAVLTTERTFLVPEVSSSHCIKRQPFADISIKVERVENGIWSSSEVLKSSQTEIQQQKHQLHHKEDLDPKLLQVAQLFVQDLLVRAKIEAHKKSASSENQALLHEDTFVAEDTHSNADHIHFVERVHQEV